MIALFRKNIIYFDRIKHSRFIDMFVCLIALPIFFQKSPVSIMAEFDIKHIMTFIYVRGWFWGVS